MSWEYFRKEERHADGKDHPVMKVAENAETFHMNGAVGDDQVPGDLADDIRHLIDGYRVRGIEQRSAHSLVWGNVTPALRLC